MDPNTRKEHEARAKAMLVDGTQLQQSRKGRHKAHLRRAAQEPASAAFAGNTTLPAAQPAAHRQQTRQRKDEVGSKSRLEQEVVSSRLWIEECQQLQPPLPDAVPTTFGSLQQYIDTFEPLLIEEAAESVRAGYEEAERAGKSVPVTVQMCGPIANGWHSIRLTAATQDAVLPLRQLLQDRDASVLVLQLLAAPIAAAAGARGTPPLQQVVVRATGLLAKSDDPGAVHVHIRPCCGRHPPTADSPCCKILEYLQQQPSANWQLIPAGSLVTSTRECGTLARLQQIPILDYILDPTKPRSRRGSSIDSDPAAATADLPVEVSSPGFWSYLHSSFDQPQIEAIKCSAAHIAHNPQNPTQQQDQMQVDIVDLADSDSGSEDSRSDIAGSAMDRLPFTLIQGPPGTGKTHTVLGVLNTWHLVQFQRFFMSLDSAVRKLAVSGVQGIERQMINDEFAAGLAQRPRILVCAPSNAAIDELLERILRGTFRDVHGNIYRPDVVRLGSEEALSSEARQVWVEQLCGRLLSHNPASYATEHSDQQQAMRMILTRMRNIADTLSTVQKSLHEARAEAAEAAAAAKAAAASGDNSPVPPGLGAHGSAAAKAGEADKRVKTYEQQTLSMVGQMVNEFEQLRKTKANLSRLALVEYLVAGPGAVEWGRKLAGIQAAKASHHHHQQQPPPPLINQPEHWRSAFRAAPRDLQQDLEVSFVDQAEMVFTTLSSSARDVFTRVQRPFELVLIDEAAQAAEIAALQPLVHGAKAVVMVGDPQQLPATIFSQAAKQLALERSLFERLAAARCPVNVLKVQYRMHPAIRMFPSAYFYNSALVDAPTVLSRPRPWFYPPTAGLNLNANGNSSSSDGSDEGLGDGVLIPYVVYDVSRGRERFVRGRSAENEAEARMAVALYGELRRIQQQQQQQQKALARLEVGVITPYRSQRTLLRKLFEQTFGKDVLREVKIETVDSFQGKQLDIVILSCVRASNGSNRDDSSNMRPAKIAVQKQQQKAAAGAAAAAADQPPQQQQLLPLEPRKGVGFLSDTRRMNVAITRARQALYILGHCDTLVSHPAWESLIADAGVRECVIWDVTSEDITNQDNRSKLAEKLLPGRQQQEAMAPQQQQPAATAEAAAGQQQQHSPAAGLTDLSQQVQQQQRRRSVTPPPVTTGDAGTPPAAAAAAAAAAGGGSSSKAWLRMLEEQQVAERKRKQEQSLAKLQGKSKKQKTTGDEGTAAAAAAAGTVSDGSKPSTPTHAAAATAASPFQQQQHEPSRLQQQSGPDQQQQQGMVLQPPQQQPGLLIQPHQQQQQQPQGLVLQPQQQQQPPQGLILQPPQQQQGMAMQPQQRQQQQGVVDQTIGKGAPGACYDSYHGMTAQQGAIFWLLSPLMQQYLIKLLLAMPQQQREAAIRTLKAADQAWVVPLVTQHGLNGRGAEFSNPNPYVGPQQQQQGAQGSQVDSIAIFSMQGQGNPGQFSSSDGGQMLLPGGILPPPAAAGPQQQQQPQQQLVIQPIGVPPGLQLQSIGQSGPSSTDNAAAAGGQIVLLPVHSPRLGPQAAGHPGGTQGAPLAAAAAAAAWPQTTVLGPGGFNSPPSGGGPPNPNMPQQQQRQQQQGYGPPASGFPAPPAAAGAAPPGSGHYGIAPQEQQHQQPMHHGAPPQQQQQPVQYVMDQEGVLIPAMMQPMVAAAAAGPRPPPGNPPPAAAAAGGGGGQLGGFNAGGGAGPRQFDTPPTAKQLKRIARNERRRREREAQEVQEGLQMAERRERERVQQPQGEDAPPLWRQQQQQGEQGGIPPWRRQQQQRRAEGGAKPRSGEDGGGQRQRGDGRNRGSPDRRQRQQQQQQQRDGDGRRRGKGGRQRQGDSDGGDKAGGSRSSREMRP